MKLIIDIPEEDYKFIKKQIADGITNPLKVCIANGVPTEQEPKTDKYEYHTDHTDCIWYGSGSCPVTCSQYRDGWNDAMEYIYKNGKGYQPYRRGE